jgi:hypothetical protein
MQARHRAACLSPQCRQRFDDGRAPIDKATTRKIGLRYMRTPLSVETLVA